MANNETLNEKTKKKGKWWVIIAAVVFLFVAIGACSGEETETQETQTQETQTSETEANSETPTVISSEVTETETEIKTETHIHTKNLRLAIYLDRVSRKGWDLRPLIIT